MSQTFTKSPPARAAQSHRSFSDPDVEYDLGPAALSDTRSVTRRPSVDQHSSMDSVARIRSVSISSPSNISRGRPRAISLTSPWKSTLLLRRGTSPPKRTVEVRNENSVRLPLIRSKTSSVVERASSTLFLPQSSTPRNNVLRLKLPSPARRNDIPSSLQSIDVNPPPLPPLNPNFVLRPDAHGIQRTYCRFTAKPLGARALQRILHPTILDRAHDLEPHPLDYHWTFPPNARYRIKDKEAFATLSEKDIEWYILVGLLQETPHGIIWAATHGYLLLNHDEPRTPGTPATPRTLDIDVADLRRVSKTRYDSEIFVPRERPATPIVERDDPFYTAIPLTPKSARILRIDRKRTSIEIETGKVEAEIVVDNEGQTDAAWGKETENEYTRMNVGGEGAGS